VNTLRRTVLKGALAGALAIRLAVVLAQQKLLRMIVPLTPGTTPDELLTLAKNETQMWCRLTQAAHVKPA
jgi:hypothetical protein